MGKTYRGKLASAVDFDHIGRLGQFSLTFVCEPLAYGEQITVDFVSDTAIVANAGSYQTPAIIEATFTGAATEFKVTLGTEYIRVVHDFVLNDTLKIDTGTGAVLINGTRAMDKLDWQNSRFFDLPVGESTLNITPTGKCTATVKFSPRWL
jgi:phage-related protein